MNWAVIIPFVIQGLSAIQPLFSGVTNNKVSAAGTGLIPIFESLFGNLAPGSAAKVAPAVNAATSVFDPNIIKWIQQILNLAGNNLDVDGELGPMTLAAAASFAEKELGLVSGGLASTILLNVLKGLGTQAT